jgi:hypothetical protein
MGYYSRGMHMERSMGGRIWKIILLPIGGLLVLAAASFFICDGRVDRSRYESSLKRAKACTTERELDRLLLPEFEKEEKGAGRIVYTARPVGKGACLCSVVMVDAVEVTCDGDGEVTQMSAYQVIGLSKLH